MGVVAFGACKDDEVKRRDVSIEFAAAEVGIDAEDASTEIDITLSRRPERALTATVKVEAVGLEYGTHFTTSPAVADGVINLPLDADKTTASIVVTKVGENYDGNETVTFTIEALSLTDGFQIGAKASSELKFGDFVSEGNEKMVLEGNGADGEVYLNTVYVDLSGNRQKAVNRKSWNIGFWCGTDFHVVLNSAYGTVATPSGKNDINTVLLTDAEAVGDAFNLNRNPMGAMDISATIFDNVDGSLSGTAFAGVSATDADNEVYFVASEGQKPASNPQEPAPTDRSGWFKVRVTRKDGGYHVEYAKVGSTDIKTVDIAKRDGYNFVFLSLETGKEVDAEPVAAKWDIRWSYDTGKSGPMHMFMQDYVSINNLGGVSVATVETADVAYADFGKAQLDALKADDFKTNRNVIGSSWRTVGGMDGGLSSVNASCFYVVKDAAGNCYKLRFSKFHSDEGATRGRPELQYQKID